MMTSSAVIGGLRTVILWLEENSDKFPSLPDVADADMALMYLRHIEKHVSYEIREVPE